jgi:hypothetical protein
MAINNRQEYINAQASEKITLATVDARTRLYVFSGPTMSIYSKVTPYFVTALKQDDQNLTAVANLASVTAGTFYYDIKTSTLYARFFSDADPQDVEIVVTYRFFFGNKGISAPHNLADISMDVDWQGRIVSTPGYKHKIGIDQALTSLVGEGTLRLKNQDAGLDDIFDTLIFENREVTIYSWHPNIPPSERRVIYRGRITNKRYDGDEISFKIKDQIFSLLDSPTLAQYTAADNVADSVQGQFKRRVYGRVDGLRCQSTDQVGDGFSISGTVSAAANSTILSGSGTSFLSQVRQNDKIIIGAQEFEVENVVSDNEIVLSDETEYSFSGQPATLRPARGTKLKNRTYVAAGHICAQVTHTIVSVPQFNRVIVDSTEGLFAGDFVEFSDTLERIEIRNIAPGNIVVLQQNVVTKSAPGASLIRRPIQEVYIQGRRVNSDDYSINNASDCGITLQDDAEFNLARVRNLPLNATFTNGLRSVSITPSETPLAEIFQPGDWVKPNTITYTTFYEVVNVNETSLDLAVNFADPTITDAVEYKSPDYITDDTIVSVNILGRTVDGTAAGTWISNAAQLQADLIKEIGITTFNTASFTDGESDSPQLVSIAIPENFSDKRLPTTKDIVDKINKSVHASLTLDNDLLIKFKTLNVATGEDLPTISDFDVIDWKISATNGKAFNRVFSKYRFTDVDISTQEAGNKAFNYESVFVNRYIETQKVDNLDLYLYEQRDAEIASHRHIYYNRLSVSTLTIQSDLRLENVEIGEVVIVDFRRLYRRYGNSSHRKKVMLVIGKSVTGQKTELILSDLGNTFNTSSYITPGTAPEYSAATDDERLIYGYITDNQGIVNDDEDSAGVHLIS